MGTSIKFTPLCGVDGDSPLCYFLEFGGCNFLLDCGWSELFDTAILEPVKKIADKVDVVLLSNPDTEHLGALPYAVNRLGMKAKVFATLPVLKMGQMFLYDQCLSRKGHSDFAAFTLDEIDVAFSKVTPLKYNEEQFVSDFGVTLTAHAAGHLVGGTVWQIRKNEQDIVYAPAYNHKKERHLGAVKLHSSLSRPAVLITNAKDILNKPVDSTQRDKAFLRSIVTTLRDGGNVLIPTDTAGRVLELIILLEDYWRQKRLPFSLVLLNGVAYSTLEFAKTRLEWLNEAISEAFEKDRDNPFLCRYLQVCHSADELENLPEGPKVVLASMDTLEAGPSRELLAQWAGNPKNLIAFMQPPKIGTLAHSIQNRVESVGDRQEEAEEKLKFKVTLARVINLEGQELEEYELKNKKRKRTEEVSELEVDEEEMGEEDTAVLDLSENFDQPLRTSSSNISRLVRQPSGTIVQMLGDEVVTPGHYKRADVLIDGFEVPEGAFAAMFPFEDDDEPWDDYGEVFHPEHFFIQGKDEASEFTPVAPDVQEDELPTKTVMTQVSIHLQAQVKFYDYSGRTNGRFVRHMVTDIAPRHLILVDGSDASKVAFRGMVAREGSGMCRTMYCPGLEERVDVSTGTNSFSVGLSDELVEGANLREFKGYQLGWVEGRLEDGEKGHPHQLVPIHEEHANGETLGGVFIGDVRLSGVKTALELAGVVAEFHGRSLVCSGDVQIKVQGAGQILMEGPLSVDYYRIREILYSQYHIC